MPKPETTIPRLAVGMQEAADAIGVSRAHLYTLLDNGELETVMVGSRRLIRMAELERLVNSRVGAA